MSINLFNDFKFNINLFSPFGLGTRKIFDTNCPGTLLHFEIALISNNLLIEFINSLCSNSFFGNTFGVLVFFGILVNGIWYPLIQDKIVESFVMSRHLCAKY